MKLQLILTVFFKGVAAFDTQELLKTQDSTPPKVDVGNTQEMLAALESEGKFHNYCYTSRIQKFLEFCQNSLKVNILKSS